MAKNYRHYHMIDMRRAIAEKKRGEKIARAQAYWFAAVTAAGLLVAIASI